jgi:ribonuclease-3
MASTAPSAPARGAALVEERLGYRFVERPLFELALTHRSFGADHNERLEFLGDAVLNLTVSRLLFDRFSGSDEGDLTRVRAHLVREDSLHRLGLPEALRLSDGEARGGGATRPSILADAVEALIGAVSIDGGFESAQALVTRLFGETITSTTTDNWRKDAKTELQEWLQARHVPVPAYRISATHGQAHAQTFEVECDVPVLKWRATGTGRSRRAAEQASAQQLLDRIKAGELDVPTRKGNPGA